MKSTLPLLLICLFAATASYGQDKKRTNREVVEDRRIYFYFNEDKKEINYFLSKTGKDGNAVIKDNDVFSMKRNNNCNIFFKWLNPLNFRIAFKDTIYASPDDAIITDYITTLFGSLHPNAKSSSTKSLDQPLISFTVPKAAKYTGATLITNKSAFETKDLNLLLVQLMNSPLEQSDSVTVNELIENLHALERVHITDYVGFINKDFTDLKKITDHKEVKKAVDKIELNITEKYENKLSENEDAQKKLDPLTFTISNKPLEVLTKVIVQEFIKSVKDKATLDRALIQKLKDINSIMLKSISFPESETRPGYFEIKKIDFEDDKNFETSFTVSSYEIDKQKNEPVKKNDLVTKTIILDKYDAVKISVSAGVFYANFTLKGYGVKQGEKSLVVTEDNIKSSTAIPATFLNFKFDINSRTLIPILQLGADPSKKRPFILFGGGIAIPKSRFAFTGGPMWTWDQSLTQLSVNKEVESTTALEKDVKYTFDMKPKGWYAGFQFTF